MATNERTENGLRRELRLAKEDLLRSLVGIPFQEPGHQGWVKIVGVTEDGAVVENADNPGDGTVVIWERTEGLIKSVAATGLGPRNADGWERKTGGGFIYDWPTLVVLSGWGLEDLKMRGVSFCMNNRKKSGEASWD